MNLKFLILTAVMSNNLMFGLVLVTETQQQKVIRNRSGLSQLSRVLLDRELVQCVMFAEAKLVVDSRCRQMTIAEVNTEYTEMIKQVIRRVLIEKHQCTHLENFRNIRKCKRVVRREIIQVMHLKIRTKRQRIRLSRICARLANYFYYLEKYQMNGTQLENPVVLDNIGKFIEEKIVKAVESGENKPTQIVPETAELSQNLNSVDGQTSQETSDNQVQPVADYSDNLKQLIEEDKRARVQQPEDYPPTSDSYEDRVSSNDQYLKGAMDQVDQFNKNTAATLLSTQTLNPPKTDDSKSTLPSNNETFEYQFRSKQNEEATKEKPTTYFDEMLKRTYTKDEAKRLNEAVFNIASRNSNKNSPIAKEEPLQDGVLTAGQQEQTNNISPVVQQQPVVETTQTQPTKEISPVLRQPVAEPATPITQSQISNDVSSVTQTQPAVETTQQTQAQPIAETASTQLANDVSPLTQTQPSSDITPATQQQPVNEASPVVQKETVVENLPVTQTQPASETTTQLTQTQPVAETNTQPNQNQLPAETNTQPSQTQLAVETNTQLTQTQPPAETNTQLTQNQPASETTTQLNQVQPVQPVVDNLPVTQTQPAVETTTQLNQQQSANENSPVTQQPAVQTNTQPSQTQLAAETNTQPSQTQLAAETNTQPNQTQLAAETTNQPSQTQPVVGTTQLNQEQSAIEGTTQLNQEPSAVQTNTQLNQEQSPVEATNQLTQAQPVSNNLSVAQEQPYQQIALTSDQTPIKDGYAVPADLKIPLDNGDNKENTNLPVANENINRKLLTSDDDTREYLTTIKAKAPFEDIILI